MSFLYPWVLIAIFPTILLIYYIKNKKNRSIFNEKIVISNKSINFKLLPIILIFIIISLSRPILEKKSLKSEDLNTIFIALDISNSMMAKDLQPNRFIYAKKLIKRFIKESPFKISLIVFTTNPLLISPPTLDKEILYVALDSINPKNILTKGTDFKKLIKFVSNFEGDKNLVIFSDGGEFIDSKELASISKINKIKICGVQLATKSGALIPIEDGYLKDENNHLIVTKLNKEFKNLSILSSKRFYNDGNYLNILKNIEKKESESKKKEYIELFFIPLLIAIILYINIFTTVFNKKFLKILPLFLTLSLKASILDEIDLEEGYKYFNKKDYKKCEIIFDNLNYLESKYALAITKMKLKKFKDAIKIFKKIKTKDKNIKSKIYYNIGLCYENIRDYENAKKFYIKSMQILPNKKSLKKIEKLAFLKNKKKTLLPFSKQKLVPKKSNQSKSKGKSRGSANINLAIKSSNNKDGKKIRQKSITLKKTKSIPISSKVYELINRGYTNEKNPW